MTQVNLLPAEVKQRQRTRRVTLLVASGAVAALALLMLVFVLQSARLAKASDELADQQQVNRGLEGQIDDLQRFADLETQLAAKKALVAEALGGQILWSGVLRDVSMVIPGEMWLTSMNGQMSAPLTAPADAAAAPVPGPEIVGTIQFGGTSLQQPVLATWLKRLERVRGWINPWISSSTKSEGGVPVYDFAGTVDITADATSDGRPR